MIVCAEGIELIIRQEVMFIHRKSYTRLRQRIVLVKYIALKDGKVTGIKPPASVIP